MTTKRSGPEGLPLEKILPEYTKRKIREGFINFVVPDGLTLQTMNEDMKFAHNSILRSSANINRDFIRILQETQVIKMFEKQRHNVIGLFILTSFSGDVFNKLYQQSLQEKLCRIFKPIAITQVFAKNNPTIPLVVGVPLVNIALHGFIVGVDAVFNESDVGKELVAKMRQMGAHVTIQPRRGVNIVVAKDVVNRMSRFARNFGIPILTPKWFMVNMWDKRHEVLHFKVDQIQRKDRIKIFKGMVFTPSQLDSYLRSQLEQQAEELGYIYSKDLRMTSEGNKPKTTHLICEKAEGDKYLYASRSPHIFVVSYEWIVHSLKIRCALSEKDYPIIGNHGNGSNIMANVSHVDESVLPTQSTGMSGHEDLVNEATPHVHPTQEMPRTRQTLDVSVTGCSQMTEKMSINDDHEDELDDFGDNFGDNFDDSLTENNARTANYNPTTSSVVSQSRVSFRPQQTSESDEKALSSRLELISSLDPREGGEVFGGIDFYISSEGFSQSIQKKLKTLIRKHGGYTADKLKDNTMYCIVSQMEVTDCTKKLLTKITDHKWECQLVQLEWLLKSISNMKLEEVMPYQVTLEEQEPEVSSCEIPNSFLGFKVTKKKITEVKQGSNSYNKDVQEEETDDLELMDQYQRSTQLTGRPTQQTNRSTQQTREDEHHEDDDDQDGFIGEDVLPVFNVNQDDNPDAIESQECPTTTSLMSPMKPAITYGSQNTQTYPGHQKKNRSGNRVHDLNAVIEDQEGVSYPSMTTRSKSKRPNDHKSSDQQSSSRKSNRVSDVPFKRRH